jgi:hypothetical protein
MIHPQSARLLHAIGDENQTRTQSRRHSKSERQQCDLNVVGHDGGCRNGTGESWYVVQRHVTCRFKIQKAGGDEVVSKIGMELNCNVGNDRRSKRHHGGEHHSHRMRAHRNRKSNQP